MDRTFITPLEQFRDFDYVEGAHDVLVGLAATTQDLLGGTTAVVAGLGASATSPATLSINLAAGRIYQLAYADATAGGSIPQDLTYIMQQGLAAAQQVTLVTTGLSSGQSRMALIQAQFSQSDAIRANDPTSGSINFYNASNPTQPNVMTVDSVRQGICTISVVYGAVATTGSQVSPSPSAGNVGLYLVTLTYGQTQITTIPVANNSIFGYTGGTAPFLAGLLNSHHGGTPGQAPKINLASEVQGILPAGNQAVQPGTLLGVRTLSAGAYTPTAGTTNCVFTGVGGGGGGGGTSTMAATEYGVGSGGCSGAFGDVQVLATYVSGLTITLGSGGAGGSGVSGIGTTGGNTSIGSVVVWGGGPGGAPAAQTTTFTIAGNIVTPPDITLTHGTALTTSCGFGGKGFALGPVGELFGGDGGSTPFGTGGQISSTTGTANGVAASAGSGAGGSGATGYNTGTGIGGNGGSGALIVREYS